MQTYLERDAYAQLVDWKNHSSHSTLEVSGARQVGKTYLVNKFADEQYDHKIYINLLGLSGELLLENYNELRKEMRNGRRFDNPVYELIKIYAPDFVDSPETVIIIDEIQESAEIYNRIREFTRSLKSDFIITGSYLGRILNKEFKYSAGDLDSLEIQTLSFREFLKATGKDSLYETLDLFGSSEMVVYQELEELYQVYCAIGGYPAVVLEYLNHGSIEDCQQVLEKIVHLFTNESKRYFEDILDSAVYDNIFTSIARILLREKKGLEEDSFAEELQRIVVKDYSSNISKATMNRAIDWLYSAGIIGFVGKINECRVLDFKAKARIYFMDMGLATFFMTQTGAPNNEIHGAISENFVFLDLKRRLSSPRQIAFETPAFATLGVHEIDFFVKTLKEQKTYAIEVKAGKNSSKTIAAVKKMKKADYILFAKGDTHGGINENIITIPIYGISKFRFDR